MPEPVLSPSRITLENNGKIRTQPDGENLFARASGGGNATGIQPSPPPNLLILLYRLLVRIPLDANTTDIQTGRPSQTRLHDRSCAKEVAGRRLSPLRPQPSTTTLHASPKPDVSKFPRQASDRTSAPVADGLMADLDALLV